MFDPFLPGRLLLAAFAGRVVVRWCGISVTRSVSRRHPLMSWRLGVPVAESSGRPGPVRCWIRGVAVLVFAAGGRDVRVLLVGCGTGCRSDRWRFGSEWVGLGGCSGAVRPARTQGVGGRGLSALMAARSVEGMPVDPPAFPRPGDHGPAALAGRRREWAATTDWLDCLSGAVVFSQAASRWGLAGRGFFRPRSPLRRRDFAGHGSVPLSAASRC